MVDVDVSPVVSGLVDELVPTVVSVLPEPEELDPEVVVESPVLPVLDPWEVEGPAVIVVVAESWRPESSPHPVARMIIETPENQGLKGFITAILAREEGS